MSEPKYVLVAHMGHNAPWLQIQTRMEIKERIAYIKAHKPKGERPLRLKLLKIVEEPLPPKLENANAAWQKADAARKKAYAARAKAYAAWVKAYAARQKANAELEKVVAAWARADTAWKKADAARQKANAALEKAIVSPEGIAFHQQVCGCAWTPERPDILLQIATQEEKE